MFLESFDCDYALKRLFVVDKRQGEMLKKYIEPFKSEDDMLKKYYAYNNFNIDYEDLLTFGGSFLNLSTFRS